MFRPRLPLTQMSLSVAARFSRLSPPIFCRTRANRLAWLLAASLLLPTLAAAQTQPPAPAVLPSPGVVVPRPALAPGEDTGPFWHYTVRPGDTLIGLAQRYLRNPDDWPQVQRDNHIRNPRAIPPGTVLRFAATLLRVQPQQARVELVYGAVQVEHAGAWQTAAPGQKVGAGDAIRTGADGTVIVVLANGTRIKLPPGSVVRFDTLSAYAGGLMVDTRLRLQQGSLEIDDNPQRLPNQNLQIHTPSAQAVVRGTRFRAAYDDAGVTREETAAGAVELQSAGARVQVGAGMGSLAKAGQPPLPPVPLLPAADLSALPPRYTALPISIALPALPGAGAWQGEIAPAAAPEQVLLQARVPVQDGAARWSIADLPDGDYRLTLRAVDANGLLGRAAQRDFTVAARPFFPLLLAPGEGATVRQPRPTFEWSAVVGVATTRLQIATRPQFDSPLIDTRVDGQRYTPAQDLPAGAIYWRAASLAADGHQGPWGQAQTLRYLPGPGPANLGRAAVEFDRDHLILNLPTAPAGQHYALTLAEDADLHRVLARSDSSGGAVKLPRPGSGTVYLGARLIDDRDGTPGPQAVRALQVPPRYPYLWLLLVPLLPLL